MKTRQEIPRKLSLAILVVMFICMLSISFGCSSIDPVNRYKRDTKEYSYQYWERGQKPVWQKVFGKGKDPRITFAEKQVKDHEKFKKRDQKESEILEKVAEIKSKLDN